MENEWKRDRRILEIYDASSTDESTDIDHPLKSKSSMNESSALKTDSSVVKKTLKNLDKKCRPVNTNFVKGEISISSRTNESVNKGYLFDRKLKKKLDAIEDKSAEVKKKRNNMNGKIGVNKHNNHAPNANIAPRKTCSKCGSVNHLSTNYKTVHAPTFSMPLPILSGCNMHMPTMNMMTGFCLKIHTLISACHICLIHIAMLLTCLISI